MRLLLAQVSHAVRGRQVEFGAMVFRLSPSGLNRPLLLETMQRGIRRLLVHLQDLLGDSRDALCDSPTVPGLERKSSQDLQVGACLEQDLQAWP